MNIILNFIVSTHSLTVVIQFFWLLFCSVFYLRSFFLSIMCKISTAHSKDIVYRFFMGMHFPTPTPTTYTLPANLCGLRNTCQSLLMMVTKKTKKWIMPQWRMPKKKSHDPATLPRNVMKAANIGSLKEHWKCAKKTADCLGTYCFINNEGTHLPLSHEHLDFWAAAMVHYLFFCFSWYIIQLSDATVKLPPNHSLFDVNSTKLSPVLQCWCDAQNQAAAPAAAPTFNFTIIKEVIDILHGNQGVNAEGPAPLYQHALPVAIPVPPAAVPISPVANPQYDIQYPNILQADIL